MRDQTYGELSGAAVMIYDEGEGGDTLSN